MSLPGCSRPTIRPPRAGFGGLDSVLHRVPLPRFARSDSQLVPRSLLHLAAAAKRAAASADESRLAEHRHQQQPRLLGGQRSGREQRASTQRLAGAAGRHLGQPAEGGS